MEKTKLTGKDLTKEAPRSPKERLGGFVILPRAIDKCRATLWGNVGEYNFDCPLDNTLFKFKGVKGEDFKKFVETGAADEQILDWVNKNGVAKTDAEIKSWSDMTENDNYSSKPKDTKSWLEGENVRLGLDKDGTLFDYLEADDKVSFSSDASVCIPS